MDNYANVIFTERKLACQTCAKRNHDERKAANEQQTAEAREKRIAELFEQLTTVNS